MKIRRVTGDNLAKVVGLLRAAFPDSDYEARLVQGLHGHGRSLHDWVCIHTNKAIAYIAFTNAYQGTAVCGLHLGPLAVHPDFQGQGLGSELLNFALRQEPITTSTLFVLGASDFYGRFGFVPCSTPRCPFDPLNAHFLSLRGHSTAQFSVGYEPEFMALAPPKPSGRRRGSGRRGRR